MCVRGVVVGGVRVVVVAVVAGYVLRTSRVCGVL